MEIKTSYLQNTEGKNIRGECFLPASKGWEPPTGDEVLIIMDKASLSGESDAAKYFGVDPRTVRRWRSGKLPIPFTVWARLAFIAGYGDIYQ